MATILVTGATGALGPALVTHLLADGHQVRVVSRRPLPPGLLPASVEAVVGELDHPETLARALTQVGLVCHLAALLHIPDPAPALQSEYQRVNVDLTHALVEAARAAGVQRLVFFSTIAVYGPSSGRVLSEETSPHPDTAYGQTKLAAEALVLNARRLDGHPLGTVLRPGAVYGARMKGNYRRLVQALARGRFLPVGDGRNRRTLVHDGDVAQAARLAMRHPAAAGRVYNVSDGHFHTMRDILAAMCSALGRPTPSLSIPVGPVRFVLARVEAAARLAGRRSPVGRATLDKYTEDVAVDSRRIRVELGFVPQFDLRSGWIAAVREMRQMGEL
jgi:nucleoside-diphosphate-sugar epimerase